MSVPSPAYADGPALTDWLADSDYEVPASPDRILARASDVITDHVFGQYLIDSATGLPTDDDPDVAAALVTAFERATCAQVEQWLEVGEENDIAGFPDGTTMALGAGATTHMPAVLAPRAARILRFVGLAPAAPSTDEGTHQLLTVELV
jgi:hypothetical protein